MCSRIWPHFISSIYFLHKTVKGSKRRRLTTPTIIQFVEMRFSAEKKIYRLSFLVSKENSFQRVLLLAGASWPVTDIWETDRGEEAMWAWSCSCLVYRMVASRLGQFPSLASTDCHHGCSAELCILVFSFFLLGSKWNLYSGGNLK